MSRRTIVSDQDGTPLISIGKPDAAIAHHAYPRETPRAVGDTLFEYVWLEHGFRQQDANERCFTCDWPTCAPWHEGQGAPPIGPLRALLFGLFCAAAGCLLTLVSLGLWRP